MCKVSEALALRTAAQDRLAAACLARVETPIAAIFASVAGVEQSNPEWVRALLGKMDEGETS